MSLKRSNAPHGEVLISAMELIDEGQQRKNHTGFLFFVLAMALLLTGCKGHGYMACLTHELDDRRVDQSLLMPVIVRTHDSVSPAIIPKGYLMALLRDPSSRYHARSTKAIARALLNAEVLQLPADVQEYTYHRDDAALQYERYATADILKALFSKEGYYYVLNSPCDTIVARRNTLCSILFDRGYLFEVADESGATIARSIEQCEPTPLHP